MSGLAEPLAGAVGWGILSSTNQEDINSLAYAILFGLVSGMMVGGGWTKIRIGMRWAVER